METEFDLNKALLPGGIRNELDLERAFIEDRLLRVMAKNNFRKKLQNWLNRPIQPYQITITYTALNSWHQGII
ncbi:hypothetical protein [Allomuricauda sp. R78024]|uniref:hypothetical protein n=1 Tax=Allomuricauda sp. R78024 TaxID=3093867 RepID=UPI0037CA404E